MAVFYATLVSTYISYFLARIAYEKKYRLIAIMFSIIVALILIFVLTTTVSRLAVRVRKLTQMVGILSKKLDSIEKNELK